MRLTRPCIAALPLLAPRLSLSGRFRHNSTRWMLVLVTVLAAALLSVLLLGTNFSSSSMSAVAGLGFPPRSLSAAPSKASSSSSSPPSPSPCTSVWDVRRPDGTAYPHNQLSAAAAVLGSVDFEDKSSKGGGKGRKHRQQAQPRPQESNEEPGGSGSGSGSGTGGGSGARSRTSRTQPTYPGGGRASGTIPSEVDGNGGGAGEGEGVVRALAGERAGSDGGQAYGGGGGGGGGDGSGHVGFGLRSVAAAIGLAAVAGIVVLMKGLFGLWNGDTVPESPAVSELRRYILSYTHVCKELSFLSLRVEIYHGWWKRKTILSDFSLLGDWRFSAYVCTHSPCFGLPCAALDPIQTGSRFSTLRISRARASFVPGRACASQ